MIIVKGVVCYKDNKNPQYPQIGIGDELTSKFRTDVTVSPFIFDDLKVGDDIECTVGEKARISKDGSRAFINHWAM